MYKYKNEYKKAFTLVELLASTAIIGMILSVVLYNYGGFNDTLAVSAAAQEMAIAIRQAQTYGINVKENSVGGGVYSNAYGIYINRSNPSSYRIFIDSVTANNQYDNGESVELVNLRNGVVVANACDSTVCPPALYPNAYGVNVTFIRPNPDARIYFTGNTGLTISPAVNYGRIRLTSPKGVNKYVIIEKTGQISVQ